MARRDAYHDVVKSALEKDGWTITHDPLRLVAGGVRAYIDLGAEQTMGAEKEGEKIAVEIKSFVADSDISELERAIGQYILYAAILTQEEPDRKLYLAAPETAYYRLFHLADSKTSPPAPLLRGEGRYTPFPLSPLSVSERGRGRG